MRARRRLTDSKQTHLVNSLFKQLMDKPEYPKLCLLGIEISSIQIKQYSLQKLFNAFSTNSLIKSIAYKEAGQVFPFPKNLRRQLEANSLKVKNPQSELFWRFKCFTHLGYSFVNLLKIFRNNRVDIEKKKRNLDLYLHGIERDSIEVSKKKQKLDNILSYFKNRNKTNQIMVNIIGKKNTKKISDVCVVETPFFGFSLLNKLQIMFFFSVLVMRAFSDLILGSGYFAFLSNEILLKKLALKVDDKYIAKEYAFSNSSISYYPAWLDVFSKRGAKVTLYFYTHNLLPIKKKGIKNEWHFLYNILTWPSYLVWDKKFGLEIEKIALNTPLIEVSKPISVVDNNVEKIEIAEHIAIFDVTPVRPAVLSNYGVFSTIYDDEFCEKFFKKIISVAEKLRQPIVIKHKRTKVAPTTKRYRYFLNRLSSNPIIKFVNPDTSAKRIILNCKASISMPFTSTAIVAKSYDRPSIYFDPSGDFEENQLASLGVNIISNEKKLILWMKSINQKIN